jgi:glutathione synthase
MAEDSMGLKVALQMDPIGSVNIDGDSTFRIALEAQARGHRLFFYTPDRLAFDEGRVTARGWPIDLRREKGNHVTYGPEAEVDLATFDVVWLRQDPPFDMGYITTTHILERIHPGTLVVNDPFWVRNLPEKLLVLNYPQLTPPTMIARDLATIRAFKARHGDIILKPLYGNGGAGVFRLDPNDRNLASLHELFTGMSREPLIVQKFLPDVARGDKRIILVDGEPVGAINRVPQAGETRSNMHAGGRPEKTGLTARDLEICAAIGPELKAKGQIFVGIDVIGDWLTEINVTSPTGIWEIRRFDGTDIAALVWDAIERRVTGRSAATRGTSPRA